MTRIELMGVDRGWVRTSDLCFNRAMQNYQLCYSAFPHSLRRKTKRNPDAVQDAVKSQNNPSPVHADTADI